MDTWPDKPPRQVIAEYFDAFGRTSDEDVLTALAALAPLPDESSIEWDNYDTWDRANQFVAFADLAAARRLKPAISLLLERACFGDPGEMMRGLRHSLEAIVAPDWRSLATICIQCATSLRPGTQLWSLDQLTGLEDSRARGVFEAASASEFAEIRDVAALGLSRLSRLDIE